LFQEVEEEAGSAGEQPVSNKLPALHCNKTIEGDICCPLFLVTGIALWLRKPIVNFLSEYVILQNNLLLADHTGCIFLFSFQAKRHRLNKRTFSRRCKEVIALS
jgi:hypothetical protein